MIINNQSIKKIHYENKEVDIGGDVVGQRLVRKAGISTPQQKAYYCRGQGYCTIFNLDFANQEEHELFLDYYSTNYPNFIVRYNDYRKDELSRIEVSSKILLSTVAPLLDTSLSAQPSGCAIC